MSKQAQKAMGVNIAKKIGLFCACMLSVSAQEDVRVEVGSQQVPLNATFTLTLVSNKAIRSHGSFPELKGFTKRGRSSSSTTSITQGRISSSHRIIQHYAPQKKGVFSFSAFDININATTARSPAFQVTVIEASPAQNKPIWSLAPSFPGQNKAPTEFHSLKEAAFFSLETNKKAVYLGEGVHVSLAFYISEENRAPLQFYNLNEQLPKIIRAFKPLGCWEENFNITEVTPESVRLGGKNYQRYTLYEATYYPLRMDTLYFTSVGLDMRSYKIAKRPSFFGRNTQEDIKRFRTRPRVVSVKPLPDHPLRASVAVGQYRLEEQHPQTSLRTGEGFTYRYTIRGEGNIASLSPPRQQLPEALSFYPPQTKQQITRSYQRVRGEKHFSYYGTFLESGAYAMGDYMEWVYFDPQTERYDTLHATARFVVEGENVRDQQIASAQTQQGFYALLDVAPRWNSAFHTRLQAFWWVGVFLLVLVGVIGWFWRSA